LFFKQKHMAEQMVTNWNNNKTTKNLSYIYHPKQKHNEKHSKDVFSTKITKMLENY